MKPFTLFLLFFCFAFSWAQKAEDFIKTYDKNGDGKVSLKEYDGDRETFYRYDRDRDGVITDKELSKEGQANSDLIKTFDRNANNVVERNEFPGTPEDFNRYDQNKDGVISLQEAQSVTAGGALGGPGGSDKTPFDQADKDGDGFLSKKEIRLTKKEFKQFDTDKDNRIGREEFLEVTKARQEKQEATAAKNRGGKTRPQNANEFMARWDKNHDDVLVQDELDGGVRYLFPQIDSDEDRKVTKTEVERYFRVQAALGFMEKYDLNGDGIVTREEFSGPEILFERCDFNQDGIISKADRVDRR